MNLLGLQDKIRENLRYEPYSSMRRMSEDTGVPFETIKKFRTGAVVGPKFSTVAKLASYYGYSTVT